MVKLVAGSASERGDLSGVYAAFPRVAALAPLANAGHAAIGIAARGFRKGESLEFDPDGNAEDTLACGGWRKGGKA